MYAYHLDISEKATKLAELQYVQAVLESKLTGLKLEGKENKQLEDLTQILERSVTYLYELYEYAEKESKTVRKLSLDLERHLKKEKNYKNE